MGKEDLERLEAPTDEALTEIGQTCCHRMQISDVADEPYRGVPYNAAVINTEHRPASRE